MFFQNAGNTVYFNIVPVSKNKISNNKYCFTVAIITDFHTQKFHIIVIYKFTQHRLTETTITRHRIHSENISSDYVHPEACLCPRILPHLTADGKDC